MTVVLDSWAVLRLLEGADPAATRVQSELDGDVRPIMSWINLGEVFYVVRRLRGHDAAETVVRDLRPRLDLDLPRYPTIERVEALVARHIDRISLIVSPVAYGVYIVSTFG